MPGTDLDKIQQMLDAERVKGAKATVLALEGIASSRRLLAVIRMQHTALGELQDELTDQLKSKEQLLRDAVDASPEAPEAATQ
jgi:hypothetical protein